MAADVSNIIPKWITLKKSNSFICPFCYFCFFKYKFFVIGLSFENNKNNMTENKQKKVKASWTPSIISLGIKLNILN